ncbi:diacylglycerol kinase (ATP) [Pilibacter termitis]|jgi:undecaprenol kinase|uniref:Diacylglycerol kinase (ATP) n=1 Tax=Pilibacter termitis TaxID=263852 RepID=A0A1T4N1C2_9ENTE|nr:diacylglycerol kinase family protein [Pilibacter termitis]SJZ72785.1 diacylglycerol kinase (ATP) [Pilibacter termitis]
MDSNGNKKGFKNRDFISSFEFAYTGIKTVFKEERNMRKHVASGIAAILLGFLLQLNRYEWLWLLLVIFLVIVMETWNTVAENIVDLAVDYHFHPLAKIAKDMAAGAVLMTSIFAGIVGMILFLPKILQFIGKFI